MKYRMIKKLFAIGLAGVTVLSAAACSTASTDTAGTTSAVAEEKDGYLTKDDITVNETYESTADSEHAIEVDGESADYSNIGVTKTGDSDQGDEADFYGDNSAVFATNSAKLSISDSLIETDGTHANAVFSYGEGTEVTISDSVIETSGNCSGGLMTTGGGTTTAKNLTINTSGNSSAAIRSDRGGGTVTVDEGYYKTTGTGSPVIYSTADITVSNAYMESTASQGVVVEGKNSVTLNDVEMVADNNKKNSDNSDYYQAVMIYQSMSGDADDGTSAFTMTDGSITNKNGDIFFVTNTTAEVSLTGVAITNEDTDGVFLRAASAGWGSEGSNGGQLNLTASKQQIDGDMIVDESSVLNIYLNDGSVYTGAINSDGAAGSVYVELSDDSTWVLTGDSYISAMTCDADAIDLNGYKLYVDGKEYEAGTASTGSAIEFTVSSGKGDMGSAPDGEKPDGEAPNGEKPDGASDGNAPSGERPEMPDGEKPDMSQDGERPTPPDGEKPDGKKTGSDET